MNTRKSDQDCWLAEAADALGEAERLTGLLALSRSRHDLVLAALQSEIMTLRHEVERLQRQRASERRRELHPDWAEYSVWNAPGH